MMQHLPGIHPQTVHTGRIRSHCLFSGDDSGAPVVLLHGNLSAATFFEALMVAMPSPYRCIAPDMRGYGDTQDLPIDARRGVRDLSEDLLALCDQLELDRVHLLGWSAGGGVAMDFTVQNPERVASLCLVAPVSPYGFGGTVGLDGTPAFDDFAGSGAGTVSTELIAQMEAGNRTLSSPFSVRSLLREHLVLPGTPLEREDALVEAMLKQRLGKQRYPGDFHQSPNPGGVRPGEWGMINALSPKYFNAGSLGELETGPPVLWLRGDKDSVVSDHSVFDLADEPQPMVGQMRQVLKRYREKGGQAQEQVFEGVGHSPFLEQPDEFRAAYMHFLEIMGSESSARVG